MPQCITKPGWRFLQRVRTKMNKPRRLMVTVVSALSNEEMFVAECRMLYPLRTLRVNWGRAYARGLMVHCLKVCIAQAAGINLWEFSLMWDAQLLHENDHIFCPRMAMLRNSEYGMTLQMVRHDIDTRYVTMRRFPMVWITKPTLAFLDTAMNLLTRFGEVVALKDVSDQWRQDDDRDGERTIEVKYLHEESGINAMKTLNGVDIRSPEERKSAGWVPLGKENQFRILLGCPVTCSPVGIECCVCDDGRGCRAKCRIVWRPGPPRTLATCDPRFAHLPPGHLLRATPKARPM